MQRKQFGACCANFRTAMEFAEMKMKLDAGPTSALPRRRQR